MPGYSVPNAEKKIPGQQGSSQPFSDRIRLSLSRGFYGADLCLSAFLIFMVWA
jgi:hypothetical protein